jgi:spore maturation protein CgeB
VVVIGPTGDNYTNSIAYGLRCNGYKVEEYTYLDPLRTVSEIFLWRTLPQKGVTYFPLRELNKITLKVKTACHNASLLLILKGDCIPIDTLGNLINDIKCPTVTWYMDAVDNVRDGLERAKITKYLLYFDGYDFQKLKAESIPSLRVDLAYDPRWYFPLKYRESLYDLNFVGTLYPNRLSFLEELCKNLLKYQLKIRLYGSYIERTRPLNIYKFSKTYPHVYMNIKHKKHAKHIEINELNNKSKIAINVLHSQSKDSLNMRAFESCGSGCFQLIHRNSALDRCFQSGKELDSFENLEEAIDKVNFYVKNDIKRESIAQAGYIKAQSCHTIIQRIQQIMHHLEKEGVL